MRGEGWVLLADMAHPLSPITAAHCQVEVLGQKLSGGLAGDGREAEESSPSRVITIGYNLVEQLPAAPLSLRT